MELLRLNTDTFKEEDLIEGWESLIWTERYRENGDFQLVTKDIFGTISVLPTDSYVAIQGSNEVMKVEDHLVERNEDGVDTLTVTGRTIEATTLENRSTMWKNFPVLPPAAWAATFTTAQHIMGLLYQAYYGYDGFGDPNDTIPGFERANSVTGPLTSMTYIPVDQRRDIYGAVKDLLEIDNLGIRNWRTPSWSPGNRLVTDVYRGTDRSIDQSAVSKVILSVDNGSLSSSKVLRTVKNLKTVAYVECPSHAPGSIFQVNSPYIPGSPGSGLSRKVLTVNVTETEGWPEPGTADVTSYILGKGLDALAQNQRFLYVEGEATGAVRVGTHYYLGDIVSLYTPHFTGKARVTEYVRTHDEQGDRGYPTFVTV